MDFAVSDQPEREIAVFIQAMRIPPEDRDAFLETACGGNEELRRKVEELLRAQERLGNFLEE
jgi:hypothetical protein